MGKGSLPYLQWRFNVYSAVTSAQAGRVLATSLPADASPKQIRWYTKASTMVFDALYTTVQDHAILSSQLKDFIRSPSSAFKAWEAIKDHYVKRAETTRPYLEGKLRALAPQPTESMEAFLSKAQELRREYEAYGIELPDRDLIVQIFTHLSLTWRQGTAIKDKAPEDLSWEVLSEYLRKEDILRRQANTKAPDALLPLGWHKGAGEAKGPGKAMVSQGQNKAQPREQGEAAPAKGKSQK
jgi:hypothetical protein